MRVRSLLIICILILVASPLAAAQTADPVVEVTLQGLPSDPIVLESNQSQEVTATVGLMADNFACTEEGTFPVKLKLAATPGAVDVFTVSPTRLNFSVAPGVYSQATAPYNKTLDSTVTLAVQGTVPNNHTHEPTLTATFLPSEISGCQASGDFPDAEATGTFTVQMVAPPPPPPTNTGGEDEGNGMPGPGLATASLALVAAALAARRRMR